VPYWPAANCYNYKEVWVHPSSRWLWILQDLAGPAQVEGQGEEKETKPVEFQDAASGKVAAVRPDAAGKFRAALPRGRYIVRQGERQREIVLVPGGMCRLDMRDPIDLHVIPEPGAGGCVVIRAHAEGRSSTRLRLAIRADNLNVDKPEREVNLKPNRPETVAWTCQVVRPKEPWVAVVVMNGDLADRTELVGGLPPRPR
jgi:hypothetical protein